MIGIGAMLTTAEEAEARRASERSRSQRRRNTETHEETAARRSTERQRQRHRRSAQISEQVDARRTADCGRSQYRRAQTPSSFEAALMDINVKKLYQFHQC